MGASLFFSASAAPPTITNAGFEGSEFYSPPETNTAARGFFYRQLWAADGDGWFNSNNPDSKFFVADGGVGGGHYGAKQSTTHHRGIVNVIADGRQRTGKFTLSSDVLFRAAGGNEGFRLKVWGVRESTPEQWDGWIDLTGPSGNDDGLDLRDFDNNLAPTNSGQQTDGAASYAGADFTEIYSGTQTSLDLSPGDDWQSVSVDVDLGSTGYDYLIVGVAFHDSTGTPSGVDNLDLQPAVNLQLAASPTALQPGVNPISLSWTSDNAIQGSPVYTITTNRAGYGPYEVTSRTSNGSSTSPLVVNYDSSLGDIVFTLTAQSPGGTAFISEVTVAPAPPELNLIATPSAVTNLPSAISLTWDVSNAPAHAEYRITSNRTDIGPFYVTSSTDPVVIPYDKAIGDVTFTLTVTDPATGREYTKDVVVKGPANDLPNVLLVLVDDMGWSDISPYGGEIHTPTLDRLAADGLRFREFHNEARCAPTRCALLTGMHMQRASTAPNASLPPMRIDNNVTIAEMLRSIGYRTYITGKWNLSEGGNPNKYTPLQAPTNRGFDYAFNGGLWGGNLADASGGAYWNPADYNIYPPDGEIAQIKYDGTDSRATMPFIKTSANGDYVLEYLRHHFSKNDGKPFFAYLAFNAPHFPLSAPLSLINRYTDVADTNPGDEDVYRYEDGWDVTRQRRYERQIAEGVIPTGTRLSPTSPMPGGGVIPAWSTLSAARKNDLARRMATYAAMVENVDTQLGRIVDDLEARGQLDNTIILFMSDNGGNYESGIYGGDSTPRTGTALANMGQANSDLSTPPMWIGGGWANVSNTPFRYYKHHTHEGGCRTPLIVHWPAGIAPELCGKWVEARGHVIDILPTLLDIDHVRYPGHYNGHPVDSVDGASLLPVFQTGTRASRDLVIEHEQNRAFFRGDWKLVTKTFTAPSIEDLDPNTVELYNLREDPTELDNLSFHRPEMLAEMITAFNAWVDSVPGLDADRRITQISTEAGPFVLRGRELIADTFDRDNIDDLDASQMGISGTLLGMNKQPIDDVYYEGFNPANALVVGKRLRLAGAVETGLKPNLNTSSVLAAGGFSVSLDLFGFSSAPKADEYVGIAAGLKANQAQTGGAITSSSSFRGNEAQGQGAADCFIEVTTTGQIRIWIGGQIRTTIPITTGPGTLVVSFGLRSGFAAGDMVDLGVVWRGKKIYGGAFAWRKSDAGYIGLSANTSSSVDVDNLIVRPAYLPETFVTVYNQQNGVDVFGSGPDDDPDNDGRTNKEEWSLGTNPSVPDARSTEPLELVTDGDGFDLLHRRASAFAEAGLKYTIYYSADMKGPVSSWNVLTPEQVSVIEESDAYEQVRLTLPAALRDQSRLFFALVVGK